MRRRARVDGNHAPIVKRPKPKRPRVSEKSIESAIITRLQTNGWRVHKLDTQSMAGRTITYEKGGKVSTRRYVDPTAVVGQPDLIAVRAIGLYGGEETIYDVIYIETKAAKTLITKEQIACHAVLRKEGHVVLVPRSEADFEEQMWKLGVTLR